MIVSAMKETPTVPPAQSAAFEDKDDAIESTASIDFGKTIDEIIDGLNDEQSVARRALGDICFVASYRSDGNVAQLYFVPEYPASFLRRYRAATTYYAIPLLRDGGPEFVELAAADPKCRPMPWDKAMELIASGLPGEVRQSRSSVLACIHAIDQRWLAEKPNSEAGELRDQVGASRGARVNMQQIVIQH